MLRSTIRSVRLLKSRLIGPPIGEWQTFPASFGPYRCSAWRILPDGSLDYRPMTEDEERDFVSADAW